MASASRRLFSAFGERTFDTTRFAKFLERRGDGQVIVATATGAAARARFQTC